MMDVRYAEEVFDDLKPSVIWFNSRRDGLGSELEDEFYAGVAVVRGRPYAYAVDHTGLRPFRLQRFTAVLYYKIEEDLLADGPVVVIVGVLIGGRDGKPIVGGTIGRQSDPAAIAQFFLF